MIRSVRVPRRLAAGLAGMDKGDDVDSNIAAPTGGQSAGVVTGCFGMNSAGPSISTPASSDPDVLARDLRRLALPLGICRFSPRLRGQDLA